MEWIPAKTIVTRNKSSAWFGTDYNMNIYKGCSHGCIYCDSRSACYHVEEFDRVRGKENALEVIRNDLSRKVKTGVVGMGAMSDPYNPREEEFQLTRHTLELLNAYEFGVAIATKSDLITRDIDILQEIQQHSPVLCKITVTTWQDDFAAKVEPRAPSPTRRLAAVRALSSAGLFSGILLMPVLPFLEDNEENIIGIVEKAHQCGARFIYPAFGVTLRQNQREWYYQKLEELFPGQGLAAKYQKRYGEQYECRSPRAKELWNVFTAACQRYGLLYRMPEIIRAYRQRYDSVQLSLFS